MRDIITEIWQTARRNKLRTSLTGFAVAWGIFMLIVLLGAGNGLINANLRQSDRFLSNSMMVFGGRTSKAYQGLKEGRRIRLQTRDITATDTEFKNVVDEVGAQYSTNVTISNGEEYIHPALLPNYGGKGMYGHHVHEAVIANHEPFSGITIHVVDNRYDCGTTLFQARCRIDANDSADDLAAKIHLLEKAYFPRVIEAFVLNRPMPVAEL